MQRPNLFTLPWTRAVSLWAAPSLVTVQRGTIALGGLASQTATINGVDLARALVVWTGVFNSGGTNQPPYIFAKVVLTNPTTVTATVQIAYGSTRDVFYQVIEFGVGVVKSIQSGTVAILGTAQTGTATITEVDLTKAVLFTNGFTTTNNNSVTSLVASIIVLLLNATTVQFQQFLNGESGDRTASYTVVEFF